MSDSEQDNSKKLPISSFDAKGTVLDGLTMVNNPGIPFTRETMVKVLKNLADEIESRFPKKRKN